MSFANLLKTFTTAIEAGDGPALASCLCAWHGVDLGDGSSLRAVTTGTVS